MIFRNPFKEIESLMKRPHNPINGYSDCEDCVEVYVQKKLDMDEIYTHILDEGTSWDVDDVAPETCNKKPVKVVEIGEVKAQTTPDQTAYDPVNGGCQIQPMGASFVGTLGIIGEAPYFGGRYLVGGLKSFKRVLDLMGISYSKRPVLLTNCHVLQTDVQNPTHGHAVAQPAGSRIIGSELWSKPLNPDKNNVDVSVASITQPAYKNTILELGEVKGVRHPQRGEYVHKYGRTTRYTTGQCRQARAVVNVNFSGTVIPFYGCSIFSRMSQAGDSGSVIVAQEDKKAVSLLFAGSPTHTIGCSIVDATKESGVEIRGNEE